MSDLLLNAVDVPFVVLNLNSYFILEPIHILSKEPSHNFSYFPFVYFVVNFGLLHFRVELLL